MKIVGPDAAVYKGLRASIAMEQEGQVAQYVDRGHYHECSRLFEE